MPPHPTLRSISLWDTCMFVCWYQSYGKFDIWGAQCLTITAYITIGKWTVKLDRAGPIAKCIRTYYTLVVELKTTQTSCIHNSSFAIYLCFYPLISTIDQRLCAVNEVVQYDVTTCIETHMLLLMVNTGLKFMCGWTYYTSKT